MDSSSRTGAVTFLFTDIEGSTRLWDTEPAQIADALVRHDRLCRTTIEPHGGDVVKMTGDGMLAVFGDPAAAVAAVVELQRGVAEIASECGIPLKMRCGLHAGLSETREGDFFGSAVNRTARIMAAAHGGQVLLSQAVVELGKGRFREGTDLLHLGRVRLRDLSTPEDVWQLLHIELPRTFPALRSLDATPNNLPQQLTSFIGREKEIAEVKTLLRSARLVTLTGSGGAGKTRLSLQVGADCIDDFADGVWFVELAPLTDPCLVPQTVATVLGIKEQPVVALTDTLARELKNRELLLLLDNCEHLVEASAQLCQSLLASCANVRILATSREALRVSGESTYRVPSLATPDPKASASVEALTQYGAVQLFIDRALAVKSSFQVNNANAPAVASICHHLDGIPLAIELAAARVRSMSVEEVNQRLDQRFRLLTGGARTALPRQQTLRSLIDWSYDLLTANEQALFRRLSVFAGGWTVQAGEQVCSDELVDKESALDLLTSLADKSLVLAEERDGATRYRLLETVRQYARERLQESGEEAQWRCRHLAYFLAMAEEAEPQLTGTEQAAWLQRLDEEYENLRSSLDWSLMEAGSAAGLRFCYALQTFWMTRGFLSEGREWCASVLEKAAASSERTLDHAKTVNAAGALAYYQADFSAAQILFKESLAIERQFGHRRGIAASLNNLGNVAYRQGDYRTARSLYEESLAIRRDLGALSDIAASLNNLGNVDRSQGNLASARALFEESLSIKRDLGNRGGVATSLANLGNVFRDQGDHASALAICKESLAVLRDLGNRLAITNALTNLAALFAVVGNPLRAARVWGAEQRLRDEIGSPLAPEDRLTREQAVATARAAIGDDAAFDLAWGEGRAMTPEQAVEYALKG